MTPELPLISVIVPVYNVEKYIRRALDCLGKQDYSPIEFILIDDGSPDGCPGICDEYAEADQRFRVIHQANKGLSGARNTGLDAARGSYITFADPDDWTEYDIYSSLYGAIAEANLEISVCGHYVEDECGGHREIHLMPDGASIIPKDKSLEYLVNHSTFEGYAWNKLISVDLVNRSGENSKPLRFETDLHICEDVLFFCHCFLHTGSIIYAPRPLYHYVIHEGSLLRSFNEKRKSEILSWERIIAITDAYGSRAGLISRRRYADSSINLMLNAVRYGSKEDVFEQKENVRRYLGVFLRSPIVKSRQKLRGLIIFCFPYLSNWVWRYFKKYHIRWPY
ncbi:MAG: glycosyltransferase [Clostridiales bacterium]|nr:glycosyltransferase [Clostridiales bacterium]